MNEDTIAAIATGMGGAGIGIIRVSGSRSVEAVDVLFKGSTSLLHAESHRVMYGHIWDRTELIDEVFVTVFKAPRSYTKEDVVEISSHGGTYVMRRILGLVLKQGVRLAEPGEFTKRAFLNGRIDLAQAESVMDIISADNERSLKNSLKQLDGVLSGSIRNLRDKILHETAYIEAALDDPEHYDLTEYPTVLLEKVKTWQTILQKMIADSKQGRIIRDGIRTVIVGKPNAGKSSLLNALAKEERAIVTEMAGTTRDTIEEKVLFGDFVLALMDTAGIRHTEDKVERIGVKKSYEALDSADLILYLVDAAAGFTEEDQMILEKLDKKKTITLFNKEDLMEEAGITKDILRKQCHQFSAEHGINSAILDEGICISAKKQTGFKALSEEIQRRFDRGMVDNSVDIWITNERHAHLIRSAYVSISLVENSINDGLPEDFYTQDLMDAYTSLGAIIGEQVEDDLVDKVFRTFCMGK